MSTAAVGGAMVDGNETCRDGSGGCSADVTAVSIWIRCGDDRGATEDDDDLSWVDDR
jgi:hypothetical protein